MKAENRDRLKYVIGILEGVSWVAESDSLCDCLSHASEELQAVVESESETIENAG